MLSREFPQNLQISNIDEDPVLKEKWCCHIPVIFVDGSHRVALRVTEARLRRAFSRAAQRRQTSIT
jgi:hypothetical protein